MKEWFEIVCLVSWDVNKDSMIRLTEGSGTWVVDKVWYFLLSDSKISKECIFWHSVLLSPFSFSRYTVKSWV